MMGWELQPPQVKTVYTWRSQNMGDHGFFKQLMAYINVERGKFLLCKDLATIGDGTERTAS